MVKSLFTKEWFLALIILILSCALGVYYMNGYKTGLEGFFADSGPTLRRNAARACERDYQACLNADTEVRTCTTAYDECNKKAQALDTSVSILPNAPSNTNQRSAQAAIAYAKAVDPSLLGKGDAVEWAKSGDMLHTQYYGSPNPENKTLRELRVKIANGYVPTKADLEKIQGNDFFSREEQDRENLFAKIEKIKAYEIRPPKPTITATVASDKGTGAENGKDTLESIRSQMRNDIKKAVREELEEIDNEYEIVYE